jgi:hypothetical protein
MTNDELRIQAYYALKQIDFPVLHSLDIRQVRTPGSPVEVSLRILLGRVEDPGGMYLTLSFSGVRDARIKQPEIGLFELPVIEISSIRERQWEGLNYCVRESEDDTLSFLCGSFEAFLTSGSSSSEVKAGGGESGEIGDPR